jgi:putative tryptophan/tyrosine transport system substrate-binding protein
MNRRAFITLLGGVVAAWPLAARAQQAGKIYRVGFLANDPAIPTQPVGLAFLDGLRGDGFIEGKNIVIERRFAEGRRGRYADLVAELLRLEVDVLVTSAEEATLAAKRATTRIPVVMLNVSDPVGQGIVASLARPEGNITGGTQDDSAEIAAKRVQLLKDALPQIARLAVLLNPDLPFTQLQWLQLEHVAPSLKLALRRLVAREPSELEGAFAVIGQDRPDALFVTNSELNFVNRRRIVELATKNHLPMISAQREYPEAGGLMSYGPSISDLHSRAASYVDRILKGAKPSDLPVEQPTKFELVLNRKTAQALGITFPPTLLILADEVIQ